MKGSLDRRAFLSLCAASIAACRRQPKFSRVDPAIAPLLPGSSLGLAGLRIDRLKKTPWFLPFLEGRRPAILRRFEERTGMDLARDVWEVVWSISGAGSLAFLRGKFGGAFGQEPRFDVPGVVKRSYRSYYLLERDGYAVLFLGSGTAVMGPTAEVERVIDGRDRPGEQPPLELIRMVAGLPICELWAVSRGGEALRSLSAGLLPLRAGPIFDALEDLRVVAKAGLTLAAEAAATFRTDADALAVRHGIEVLQQSALLREGRAVLVRRALEKAQVEIAGREVRVQASLGFNDLFALLG